MSEMEIRWATLDDSHDLGCVHSKSYRDAYTGIIPEEFLDEVTVNKREEYYRKTLIAGNLKIAIMFVDKKAAGFIVIGKNNDKDLLDKMTGEVFSIYLLKDYSRKGYGKELLAWGMNKRKEFGWSHVAIWTLKENTSARSFYERLGFVFDGTERIIIRGKEMIQVRYQKTLSSGAARLL